MLDANNSVTFRDIPDCNSQQTIVKMLRDRKYDFEQVNEYDNTQFYCVTECQEDNGFKDFLWRLGIKCKYKVSRCKMAIVLCGKYSETIFEPMVFTRNDVLRIIKDVPETYIGKPII